VDDDNYAEVIYADDQQTAVISGGRWGGEASVFESTEDAIHMTAEQPYTEADVDVVAEALWQRCSLSRVMATRCDAHTAEAHAVLDALAAAGRLLPEGASHEEHAVVEALADNGRSESPAGHGPQPRVADGRHPPQALARGERLHLAHVDDEAGACAGPHQGGEHRMIKNPVIYMSRATTVEVWRLMYGEEPNLYGNLRYGKSQIEVLFDDRMEFGHARLGELPPTDPSVAPAVLAPKGWSSCRTPVPHTSHEWNCANPHCVTHVCPGATSSMGEAAGALELTEDVKSEGEDG
jgi:hypothetical protein